MITAELPVVPAAPPPPALHRRAWVEDVLGASVSVNVRAVEPTRPEIQAAVAGVYAHLRRADEAVSTWRADVDLPSAPHRAVDETRSWLADITALCLEAEDRTDGLFRARRRSTGSGRAVLDPTAMVTGWAVAAAATHLDVVPDMSYSIGVRGDVVVGSGPGPSATAPTWRIEIEDPTGRGRIADVVHLRRGAVATAGASRRGGQVEDLWTGPAVIRAGSCTVIGPDLTWADVWATAARVDPEAVARLLPSRDPAYRLLVL
jgi:thiamine biosynthesis lipoprotein